MRSDFRASVVRTALRFIHQADEGLRIFAYDALSGLRIPGFRTARHALDSGARGLQPLLSEAIDKMPLSNRVTTAVICLWAAAEVNVVKKLRSTATERGFTFREPMDWQVLKKGFNEEPVREMLGEIAEEIAKTKEEQDSLLLATWWLSTSANAPALAEELVLAGKSTDLHVVAGNTQPRTESDESIERTEELTRKDKTVGLEPAVPSLVELKQRLESASEALTASAAALSAQIHAFQDSVAGESVTDADRAFRDLQSGMTAWQTNARDAVNLLPAVEARIRVDAGLRPDLDISQTKTLSPAEQPQSGISAQARLLVARIEGIADYDKQRRALVQELTAAWAELAQIQADGTLLSGDQPTEQAPHDDNIGAAALADLRLELGEMRQRIRVATAAEQQSKAAAIRRIQESLKHLKELTGSPGSAPNDALELSQIAGADLAQESAANLKRIETDLSAEVARHTALVHDRQIPRLAEVLTTAWNPGTFVGLLGRLAEEHRDVELLLALVTSPAATTGTGAPVSASIVEGLLRGVEALGSPNQFFETLSLFASDLLMGVKPNDPIALTTLCLPMIGAYYCGGQTLPDGLLWQLGTELPMKGMTAWNQLWQAALQNEPLPEIVGENSELATEIGDSLEKCRQVFAQEVGKYARMRSVKSSRHVAIMNTVLVPAIHARFRDLVDLNEQLQMADSSEVAALIPKLTAEVASFDRTLGNRELEKTYDDAAAAAKIDDSDTFHRRTCLRHLTDCAEKVNDYGRGLVKYWTSFRTDQVPLSQLRHELTLVTGLGRYGAQILKALCDPQRAREPRDYDANNSLAKQRDCVEAALLLRASIVVRLPRLAGHLTVSHFRHDDAYALILTDLAEASDFDSAASILLENEAPNQMLLFAKSISLELQKQGLALKSLKERDADDSIAELIKLGGDANNFSKLRELGRWRLLKVLVASQVDSLHQYHEQEAQKIKERTRSLRARLISLDMPLYDARSDMPAEAYRIAQQGLTHARHAIDPQKPRLLDEAERFAADLEYRLDHHSWVLSELQNGLDGIEREINGQSQPDLGANLSAREIKELLEANELKRLGLNPSEVTPSEVNTRCELLASWLGTLKLPSHLTKGLNSIQRGLIVSLFQNFSTMVQFRHVKSPEGKPVGGDDPVIFTWEELMYPRTSTLDNHCVLLALPGNPPGLTAIKEIERVVEEKQWLDFGYFVLLFVPGCTPAIRKRLETGTHRRGLVVIDERTLTSIILAEAELKTPLGVLRALMLNSKGAENVDVFTINQLVVARTAIFEGRDYLVNKIASSADNYQLFGGRRIGKSSVLKAIETLLRFRDQQTVMHSFEGDLDCSDNASAMKLARMIPGFSKEVKGVEDFKSAMQDYLSADPQRRVTLLLDEVDRYINANPRRHVLIEVIRALSDQYSGRLRVVFSGFMGLYDCLKGRGPYTPTSDPWQRMRNTLDPLANLTPASAENIVREGFLNILGWKFEHRAIPQQIVQRTGGHPAFVQFFCKKIQERVGQRADGVVTMADVMNVFEDDSPQNSFISYVNDTLYMNLKEDPIGYYVTLWLAKESSSASSFTFDQCREWAHLCKTPIPDADLLRSLERLTVTGVVSERSAGVYEFSVRDYPSILARLGQTSLLNSLEEDIAKKLKKDAE
jgi:hypothetical protein